LQRLLASARALRCQDAMPGIETLGDEDKNVPFTIGGFGAFMKPAHFQYYLGIVENACGGDKAAKKRWARLSKSNEPIDSIDYIFPLLAAKSLGEANAGARIEGGAGRVAVCLVIRRGRAPDRGRQEWRWGSAAAEGN
jgi:hypothetical protein